MEERDKGLVAALDEQNAERVIVESNALEGLDDGRQDGASRDCKDMSRALTMQKGKRRTVANAAHVLVGEHGIFLEVDKATCLFNQGRWKSEGEALVVDELRVEVIIHLRHTRSEHEARNEPMDPRSTKMKHRHQYHPPHAEDTRARTIFSMFVGRPNM